MNVFYQRTFKVRRPVRVPFGKSPECLVSKRLSVQWVNKIGRFCLRPYFPLMQSFSLIQSLEFDVEFRLEIESNRDQIIIRFKLYHPREQLTFSTSYEPLIDQGKMSTPSVYVFSLVINVVLSIDEQFVNDMRSLTRFHKSNTKVNYESYWDTPSKIILRVKCAPFISKLFDLQSLGY